nr:extracellular matrix/biofilm biosynthesis regulator RemA family protein [uncultured Ruminococcus sp.]
MYLHLGENTVVRTDSIIGIFDMDTSTISKWTKDYLSSATKNKRVINVSMELPKSFVVCNENNEIKVYVSQISSQTLMKRKSNF